MMIAPPLDVLEQRDHRAHPIRLEEFLWKIQRGSLIFLEGDSMTALVVQWFTWSKWSHVGMVDMEPNTKMPFLLESISNADGCMDVLTESAKKIGVRLVCLRERLERYARSNGQLTPDGQHCTIEVGLRHLWIHQNRQQAAFQALDEFQTREHCKNYEQSKLTLVRAQYADILGPQPQDTSEYQCSELVTEAMQQMGLLSRRVVVKQYTPKMLAQELLGRLPFKDGVAALEPVLYIYRIFVPYKPHV
jgi:hypothetical protein